MNAAIISDVHGNLEALTAVLSCVQPSDEVWCLGDMVGYGPNPNECVALIRARASAAILGNHDVAALDGHGLAFFNDNARSALEWTRGVLAPEHAAWLDGLAYELRMPEYLLVHGAPVDYFAYILGEEAARKAFAATDAPLVLVGHTHVADYYALAPDGTLTHAFRQRGGSLTLEPNMRYIVNVGSVGQPRDLNPDASFVVYDPSSHAIEWKRAPYELARTQAKIDEARLPAALARRLSLGR